MFTNDYYTAMYDANCSGDKKINTIHLLIGILYVKNSNAAILLNEYNITIDWIKEKINTIRPINDSIMYNYVWVSFDEEVSSVINESIALAKFDKVNLDHVISRLLRKNSIRNLLQKLFNTSDWECLVHQSELAIIVDDRNNSYNQVVIE